MKKTLVCFSSRSVWMFWRSSLPNNRWSHPALPGSMWICDVPR